MSDVTWAHLQKTSLQMDEIVRFLYHPRAGGVDIFVGTTRQWTGEKETVELSYECYEAMALKEMERLLAEACEQWPVVKTCLVHRLGVVPVAEASVIIGVATPASSGCV